MFFCDSFFNCLVVTWQYMEPIIGYSALLGGLIYWLRVRWAKRRRYQNRGGKNFVLALQIGRPVSEAVKSHFSELDHLVDVAALLGKPHLESDKDYQKVATEVYRAMAANQNCPIKIVLSGPVGLSMLIGQLVGLAKFDVEVYQFDPPSKGYKKLPVPELNWLK